MTRVPMQTTDRRTPGRRGHPAREARRWAVGLSVGATVVLTGVMAAATAKQLDTASDEAAAADNSPAVTAPATSRTAPPTTAATRRKPTATTTPPTTSPPRAKAPAAQTTPRKPVARSRASG